MRYLVNWWWWFFYFYCKPWDISLFIYLLCFFTSVFLSYPDDTMILSSTDDDWKKSYDGVDDLIDFRDVYAIWKNMVCKGKLLLLQLFVWRSPKSEYLILSILRTCLKIIGCCTYRWVVFSKCVAATMLAC